MDPQVCPSCEKPILEFVCISCFRQLMLTVVRTCDAIHAMSEKLPELAREIRKVERNSELLLHQVEELRDRRTQ